MKFSEAIEQAKLGKSITRSNWKGDVHFKLENKDLKCYRSMVRPYVYNEQIMLSEGWLVSEVEGNHQFYEIIDLLKNGKKAYLPEWKEHTYITLDNVSGSLLISCIEEFPFIIEFKDMSLNDWVVID